jgi:uncharacterized phage-like protein YoqJ
VNKWQKGRPMYKIGIIGHSLEHFKDHDSVQSAIRRTIDLLGYQYGIADVVFAVHGNVGVGMWAAQAAYELGYKYHMFLPYPIENTYKHWYEDQRQALVMSCNNAYSITTCRANDQFDDESRELLIDESNFTICFWVGKRQGKTFNAIKYAHSKNKLILNGSDELKLITNASIKKRK